MRGVPSCPPRCHAPRRVPQPGGQLCLHQRRGPAQVTLGKPPGSPWKHGPALCSSTWHSRGRPSSLSSHPSPCRPSAARGRAGAPPAPPTRSVPSEAERDLPSQRGFSLGIPGGVCAVSQLEAPTARGTGSRLRDGSFTPAQSLPPVLPQQLFPQLLLSPPSSHCHPSLTHKTLFLLLLLSSLNFAAALARDLLLPVPEEWEDRARKIKVPFDEERKYHPEYDGYSPGERAGGGSGPRRRPWITLLIPEGLEFRPVQPWEWQKKSPCCCCRAQSWARGGFPASLDCFSSVGSKAWEIWELLPV